jgi:hypothetical protein
MHPMQIVVAILLVPVYWWAQRQSDEARALLRVPAILNAALLALVLAAVLGGVVFAQSTTDGTVPWPDDPWCQIYWWLGWPLCWF